jgi:cysteinyl-tRNA synthetase
MSFVIFDTYSRKKVEFKSIIDKKVQMYNCGPTIYDFAHIGNFRANVFADLLKRWLQVSGYEVQQIMNLTDVDDKTIKKSRTENLSLNDITDRYAKAFFEDLDELNIIRADIYPAATDHVDEMVEMIQALVEKGHAYRTEDGSYYFRVESYDQYGNLSGKKIEDLQIGERVTSDEYESKDDVRDFALWKGYSEEDGDVFWETPIGKGRPGWHIECSAMSMKYLGAEFDIHTGGVDNIFPHHENEIAQSRCATGKSFARNWMHCEYLVVEGKKMSKSLGNFYTIRDLIDKGYSGREIRYVLVGTHYRSQLNFTLDGLSAARTSLKRLDAFYESLDSFNSTENTLSVIESLNRADYGFDKSMNDDLNVSVALASIFSFVREVNALAVQKTPNQKDAEQIKKSWKRWDESLGVLFPFKEDILDIDVEWVERLIAERIEAKKSKDWAKADSIRDQLAAKNVVLKDGADGTTWKMA